MSTGAGVTPGAAGVEGFEETVSSSASEVADAAREGPSLGVNDVMNDVMMSNNWLRAAFVVLYAVIFVVGLSGNSLVVYVVSRNAAMRTITNIFIANLAVSDIITAPSSTWPCLPGSLPSIAA